MKELRDRVAVVTGAAGGIGTALAERFAADGMKLVLADIDEQALSALVDRLDGPHVGVVTDVSDARQVAALADRAFGEFGAVHLLCNNAGVASAGLTWELSLAEWERSIGINLWGVIHGLHYFLPRMLEQPEGHVVNTASVSGLLGGVGTGPYSGTKHAVVGISETLHHDLAVVGAPVRVSVLCPSWVRSNIHNSTPAAAAEQDDQSPAARVMRKVGERIGEAVRNGMPPQELAGHVVDAVRDERFWILTHPGFNPVITDRFARAVAGDAPVPPPIHPKS